MNIQQALNQSLLSAATATYFASDIIDKGKQSAIDKSNTASAEKNESIRQHYMTRAVQRDVYNELHEDFGLKDGKTNDEVREEINQLVDDDAKVIAAKERQDLAKKNYQRAERNLKRWDLDRNEVNSYKTIHKMDYYNMMNGIFSDMRNAVAEDRALRSQQRQQETYTNQNQAKQERIDTLHNKISHSNINPNPSVSKEVE